MNFVLRAWWILIRLELIMSRSGIAALQSLLLHQGRKENTSIPTVAELCYAVELACVFYFKEVLCLQRSVAAALLLRRYGYQAELVIGARIMPFKSHAWVEIDGQVVNDKPYMPQIYRELSRS